MHASAATGAGAPPSFLPLPEVPAGWYYLGPARAVARGPVGCTLPDGRQYVGFTAVDGRPAVVDGRCCHLRADLSGGQVIAGRLVCPLHGWEFGPDGRCTRIPAQGEIPPCARLGSYG